MAKQKRDFKSTIIEKINLPSRGFPYGDSIPESFNIRPMTLNETKLLYGSSDTSTALDEIIKQCVDVEDFPVKKLLMGDKLYISYQIRILTFGEKYESAIYCPTCKKFVEASLDLSDIEINYAPEDFKTVKDIGNLPVSGDNIVTKTLTVGDFENVLDRAREIKKDYPDYQGDPLLPLTVAAQIVSINDKKMNSRSREEYAHKMHAMDEIYFSQMVDDTIIGPATEQHADCPECGKDLSTSIQVGEDFFRPKLKFGR